MPSTELILNRRGKTWAEAVFIRPAAASMVERLVAWERATWLCKLIGSHLFVVEDVAYLVYFCHAAISVNR